MGGKVAFLRIRNCASQAVTVTLESTRNIEDLPDAIGVLEAGGGTFPATGVELAPGQFYHRLKGEPTRRIHKDGKMYIIATTDDGTRQGVRVNVDHDKWWKEPHEHEDGNDNDEHECKADQGIVLVVDVDDDEDDPKLKDAFCIEVRIYDAVPTAAWMGHMAAALADKPLCRVAMPGTHDSCTYKWDKDLGASPDNDLTSGIQDKLEFGKGIIRKIGSKLTDGILQVVYNRLCQCQDMTTAQQLKAGIRYLDLRLALAPDGKSFYSCHGVYCVNATEILSEIKDFLDANPKEIVLLDFNHFYGMEKEHHDQLAALVTETLGDKMATTPELKTTSTVQEFWDAEAQVVAIYHDTPTHEASNGKLWHKFSIASPWPNKNKTNELHEKLDDNVKKRNKNKFFVLQGILTPDGELIKDEILENKGDTSIKSIASRVSGKVVNWVGDEWQKETHNVVIVDFFEDCSMVPAIINLNK